MGKIKRELNTNEKLKEMLNTVNDIKACLEDVISEPDDGSGKAMSQICIEHNIDYLKFRRLFQTKLFTEIRSNTVIKSSDIELPELDPYEKLFSAVFALRDLNNVEFPVDFKESVDYLLSSEKDFTEKERMVINLRYGFVDEYKGLPTPLTLNEVGSIMNLSKDRIRQIEAKALRKFRHPSRSKILREGLMEIEAKRKIEQIKFNAERKAMEEKVKETIAAMKEPDVKENIKDTVDIDNLCDILKEIHISELTLSSRAYNCLVRGRIKNLYELVVKSDEELLNSHGMGEVTLHEVKKSLNTYLNALGITPDDVRFLFDVRFLLKESKSEKSESDKPEELPTKGFESEDGYKYDVRFRKIK